jgi:gluconate 5-dehydrogenase
MALRNLDTNVFRLDNRTALVTGGGSGLGLAIAQAMVQAGARVVLVGRRSGELESAAMTMGPGAAWAAHDVRDFASTAAFAAGVIQKYGSIDILVNSAGVHLKKRALETDVEEFQGLLDIHVLGAHALIRAFAPAMVDRRRGSILFIASMASLIGIPEVMAYSAAKSAHLGMVRSLATELSPSGVRVNAIAPGWIDTPMSRRAMQGDPARERRILSRTPMGRFGTPEEVALAAVYLCSDAAGFVTGAVLPVDGGASIGF